MHDVNVYLSANCEQALRCWYVRDTIKVAMKAEFNFFCLCTYVTALVAHSFNACLYHIKIGKVDKETIASDTCKGNYSLKTNPKMNDNTVFSLPNTHMPRRNQSTIKYTVAVLYIRSINIPFIVCTANVLSKYTYFKSIQLFTDVSSLSQL